MSARERFFVLALGSKALEAGLRRVSGVDRARVEVVELTFDVALELQTVLPLERAQFVDFAFECRTLLVELLQLNTLLGLGFGNDARRSGVSFSNQGIALFSAFLDVLFVQAASQLQQVGRAGRLVDRRRDDGGNRSGNGLDGNGLG